MAIFNRRNKFREYSFFFFFAVAKWRPEIELDDVSYFIYVEEGGEKKKNKGSNETVVKFSTGRENSFY